METILNILQMLFLLAFIVGMFSPKTVRCSSRGKVALIYLGLLLIISIFADSLDTRKHSFLSPRKTKMEKSEEASKEIPDLEIWDKYTINCNNGIIEITFSDIEAKRTPKGTLNLVFTLKVKNDTGKNFSNYDVQWKLVDSGGVELDEADVYLPDNAFEYYPSIIHVEPYSEEEEKMGYNVKEDATYYLKMQGKIIAKVPVGKYMY